MINRKPRKRATKHRTESSRKSYWIYGLHAVLAALQNSTRQHDRLIATHATISIIDKIHNPKPEPETLTSENITGLLPPGVVHQGMALLTTPLQAPVLKNILPKTVFLQDAKYFRRVQMLVQMLYMLMVLLMVQLLI